MNCTIYHMQHYDANGNSYFDYDDQFLDDVLEYKGKTILKLNDLKKMIKSEKEMEDLEQIVSENDYYHMRNWYYETYHMKKRKIHVKPKKTKEEIEKREELMRNIKIDCDIKHGKGFFEKYFKYTD